MSIQELRELYDKQGFLVIEDCVSQELVEECKGEIEKLLANLKPEQLPEIFTTGEKQSKTAGEHFLDSGDKVRYFLEEKAERDENGKLIGDVKNSINKIGHGLYEHNDVFKRFTGTARHLEIAKEILGLKEPLVAQSMVIFKQARIGGEVYPHQDGSFLYTTPESVAALWWPLGS
eukprot:TRINITY_DN15_c0_g1_i1.p1 TRINITY_DN15_c0_g1~~TRINITY_DN15_c0_g1_i1.p1  ORF type:complete len:188 (+),score=36.70 TRINITY_DN15_c0_g1_i1:40-564(+)